MPLAVDTLRTYLARVATPLVKVFNTAPEVAVAVGVVADAMVTLSETVTSVPDEVIVPGVTVVVTTFCSATNTPVPGAPPLRAVLSVMVEVPLALSLMAVTVLTSPLITTVEPTTIPLRLLLATPSDGTTITVAEDPAVVTVPPSDTVRAVGVAPAPEVLVEPETAAVIL